MISERKEWSDFRWAQAAGKEVLAALENQPIAISLGVMGPGQVPEEMLAFIARVVGSCIFNPATPGSDNASVVKVTHDDTGKVAYALCVALGPEDKPFPLALFFPPDNTTMFDDYTPVVAPPKDGE